MWHSQNRRLRIFLLILLSTILHSSISLADWIKVTETSTAKHYVDLERIRNHEGYLYIWTLSDFNKLDLFRALSSLEYSEVDCKIFRFKYLHYSYHKEQMGKGFEINRHALNNQWIYPPPKSPMEIILQLVCKNDK